MNLVSFLEKKLNEILKSLGYNDDVVLNISNRPDLGDYQYNGCMKLASISHEKPVDIANKIVSELEKTNYFSNINIAGPGFINLTINDETLVKYINEVINDFNVNTYKEDETKTIFLDYGGANVAKALHAGHLRSPNIGEALKRLCEAVGHKTISDVHFGDWGRPMGLIICELKERFPDSPFFNPNFNGPYPECPVTLDDLYEIYPLASAKAKEDPLFLEEARELTVKMQNKEKGIYDLYLSFTKLSIDDIKDIYNKLNATFDLYEGEKDADEYIPELLDYLTKNNLTEISEGATIIDVKEETDKKEMPPVILIKSNGGVLYDTTELATLYSRAKRYDVDAYFYLTDIRQELHFVQAFRAAYKTALVDKNVDLEWFGFGTMNGPDGKPFKTRDGGVMSLRELIKIVALETRKIIKDNIPENEKDDLAEKLAISAIKYADLLPNRSSDYLFDPVKFSDINGKTGPYLLYSTVRMASLLNKAKDISSDKYKVISTKEERDIILNLLNLSTVIEKSFNSRTLNEICEYLYRLTNSYNSFYSNHEVLTETDLDKKESYIALTKLVHDTNKYLLNILAIDVPNKI
ncbi:MAG: arginine--tRNA ligase [Bacilli bacterium]|nr:arginine--tRNA ligase [Bacilli bacterium]